MKLPRWGLRFPSYDCSTYARLGHGQACVLLTIEDPDYHARAGIVLLADDAERLGRKLMQQARYSRQARSASPEDER